MSFIVLKQEQPNTSRWVSVGFSTEVDPKDAIRDATKRSGAHLNTYVALPWKPAARCKPQVHLLDVPADGSRG